MDKNEEYITKFGIVADISKTVEDMLKHVDRYQLAFHIDFTYDKLTMVGISANKSKLVAIVSKFETIYKDLHGLSYFNFVCKMPEFSSYSKFRIIKDGEEILLGSDNVTKAVFYEEELYTDWNGSGECVYDHTIEVDSEFLNAKMVKHSEEMDVNFQIGLDKKVYMTLGDVKYSLGETLKSKSGFDNVDYTVTYEDLKEVLDDVDTRLIIYFNKDCPVLIKRKSEQNSIKKSYIIFALV